MQSGCGKSTVSFSTRGGKDSLQCPFLSEHSAQAWEILDSPLTCRERIWQVRLGSAV